CVRGREYYSAGYPPFDYW
nr:immunoglobulin heavy chain junction region [Macaca mulatta]MOV40174.1 immunoglobulin heavy chain junction region [Macaca mulatta]MOV41231.1 immunoglobulin heavy chain junction region [Macaca mulatta]MOV41747.1 immunoglobulin heavy chain junction region [Macaca mulatta]MOV42199.1 immunoglobulin heavy chain junction region [Macaca mulatta]